MNQNQTVGAGCEYEFRLEYIALYNFVLWRRRLVMAKTPYVCSECHARVTDDFVYLYVQVDKLSEYACRACGLEGRIEHEEGE